MKITGNATTIKFEVEKPDEIPMLTRLGSKLGPYCGSFSDSFVDDPSGGLPYFVPLGPQSIIGIEVSTKALLSIVEASALDGHKLFTIDGTKSHHAGT